ncbi:alpha/beta fold hydrolase [Phototrophicus methaneseepsis]|uniref:Alpha/beta fold hydrolase n=1 Tax=Phototrophicus methaneseepsis TaxID=2710758 RepID=A0A7S8IE65_9CHLR|nr:alpha/beta fold hydrolase [Phototrophicus methaneseepsis]QPC81508.1 alpha/beta fold hydrolase [Phototrophicus methaneseepsis]
MSAPIHPHENAPILETGVPIDEAKAAMVLIHGRGAGPHDMISLLGHINGPGYAYKVPGAANSTWYPNRFIVPRQQNEPYLSSALQKVDDVVAELVEQGIPTEKIMLLGFSQGACLAVEYAARHPHRYGGVVALSGGLIGADDELDDYDGQLAGTPIYLGCDDADFHIPQQRVHDSAAILSDMGADVTKQLFHGLGHTINNVELAVVRQMMQNLTAE